ncbi:SPOR domain-containing protein [Spirosoma rhododendri]|uniref:SPOR domain-containing protein n=1 Tax=Spirosoma rhododendri TaxID=2728024 RepID=A0A7L5DN14_9BACT|nr:SPOR domain-containing protein [Spirosoma rhododendri]QJD77848.1 SPOR domain-containing protein [Spirosoma rhododendri]
MDVRYGIAGISLIALLTGCATSRPVSSGNSRPSTSYGAYSEDLSAVRPTYGPATNRPATTRPTSTSSAPASSSAGPPPAPPRRTEPRRSATPAAPTLNVNRQLDAVLDTLAVQNRSIRYAPGFRIQVYVGTQRQEVDATKALIAQNFPELNPYLSYNQPTYKLKIGDFMRRIDAERYYASIKQLIRSAQLQGDKVDVRRALLIK